MRKMKDSGVEWIGEMPLSWSTTRIKNILEEKSVKGMPDETVLSLYREYGVIPKDSRDDNHNVTSSDTSTYKFVEVGDFVINKMKAWQGSMALSRYQGIISPAYLTYRFKEHDVNPRYLHHLLRSAPYADEWAKLSTGIRIGQWDLHSQDFLGTIALLPPAEEQETIARFIDKKSAEIDKAIEAAEASIEEYKLYKKSVIFQAVTKGLNPDVPMKDSGIEWLRTVPAHWDVLPHKYLMHKEKNICEKWTGEDVVSLTMQGVIVRDLVNPKGKMPATFDGYQYVEPSNLLLCLFDVDVTPRCVGLIKNKGVTSPAYSQFVIHENTDASYMNWYLTAIDNQKLYLHLTSTLRSSFTADDFGKIPCCHPPIEEQRAIAAFLDKKTLEIDEAVESKQQIIEDLKGYKKALIFEAVTGKREVPCL